MRRVEIIYGKEEFLRYEIRKKLLQPFDPLQVEIKTAKEFDPARDLPALESAGLFAAERVLVVTQAQKIPKEAKGILQKVLKSPTPLGVLILEYEEDKKPDKPPIPHAFHEAFLKGKELLSWIQERARSYGIKFEEKALNLLIQHTEGNLRSIVSYLSQLQLYAAGQTLKVSQELLAEVLGIDARYNIYALGDALANRDMSALDILTRLIQDARQDNIFATLSYLTKLFRESLQLISTEVPFQARVYQRLKSRYTQPEIIRALKILYTIEKVFKGLKPTLRPEAEILKLGVCEILLGARGRISFL